MSQMVIYKGIVVEPVERDGEKLRIRSKNPADAQKASLEFTDMQGTIALFEAWVPETECRAVDLD